MGEKKKKKISIMTWIGILLVSAFAILCVSPLIYMILMSFTQADTLYIRMEDITFNLQNYGIVLFKRSYDKVLLNSIIVVVLSCLWNGLVSTMAAYGFEKKPVPGKELIFKIFLVTLMIPGQVTLIPLFLIMRQIGWLNTYAALFIPMAGAFGIFMIRSFMSSVPDVLLEAAQIDGCSEFYMFWRIAVPLVRPAVVSLTIFTFVSAWNAFIWPLVSTTKSEMYTLIVALSLLTTQHDTNYGLMMAGATISFLFPFCLYIFLQRQFVEGIALGGVKG